MKPLLLLFAAIASLADGPVRVVATGQVIDYTESRYNEPRPLSNRMDSCVARDYTVDLAAKTVVLRQTTCHPNLYRAHAVEIGQSVTTVEGTRGQMGIELVSGKVLWLQVFKVTRHPVRGSTSDPNLMDHIGAEVRGAGKTDK